MKPYCTEAEAVTVANTLSLLKFLGWQQEKSEIIKEWTET